MKIEELIQDPGFIQWANGATSAAAQRWEDHLVSHPEDTDLMLSAKMLIKRHRFEAEPPGMQSVLAAWTQTHAAIRSQEKRRVMRRRVTLAAAACMAIALTTAFLMTGTSRDTVAPTMVQTAPGEMKTCTLDDGSRITLNGNSTLKYPQTFAGQKTRTVSLRGEGFFEITHSPDDQPFVVQMSDAQVRVLGTTFNIKSRMTPSRISLLEGSVEIASASGDHSRLNPGESAMVYPDGIVVAAADVDAAASWRHHLWVFDETPLREVLDELNTAFGVRSDVASGVNINNKISGRLSTQNLSTLYDALEMMLGISIAETADGIVLRKMEGQ